MSFRKTVPVFAYVRRVSVVLSVHADKTDEEELQTVVDTARALLGESSAMSFLITPALRMCPPCQASTSSSGRWWTAGMISLHYWINVHYVANQHHILFNILRLFLGGRNLDRDILQKCAIKLDAGFNHECQKLRSMDDEDFADVFLI